MGFLVLEAGIEPALPKKLDFESSASTSSATRALSFPLANMLLAKRSASSALPTGRQALEQVDGKNIKIFLFRIFLERLIFLDPSKDFS